MEAITIKGVEIFLDAPEKYIQINDISGDDLTEVHTALAEQYPGYELTLCFRDVPIPEKALAAIGADVLEDCHAMKVTPQEFTPKDCGEIVLLDLSDLLNNEAFAEFAALHDRINPAPDMFWSSQRILKRRDIWRILVLREEGKITGYTMIMMALRNNAGLGEIFCVEADTAPYREALFSAAVRCAFENGKTTVLRMVECDDINEKEAALAVGFRITGHYRGYTAVL